MPKPLILVRIANIPSCFLLGAITTALSDSIVGHYNGVQTRKVYKLINAKGFCCFHLVCFYVTGVGVGVGVAAAAAAACCSYLFHIATASKHGETKTFTQLNDGVGRVCRLSWVCRLVRQLHWCWENVIPLIWAADDRTLKSC